ncbi:hypothetical protein NQ317_007580, partial [Molorchus minor]
MIQGDPKSLLDIEPFLINLLSVVLCSPSEDLLIVDIFDKHLLHGHTLTYLRIGVNLLVGLMLGTLYWNAGNDGSKVLDTYNLLFSILMHHMMSTMMLTILTFPSEMSILIKEHFNRWYSLKMYYVSVTLVDIPLSVVCCFVFTVIIYITTDQPLEWVRFGMFFATSLLTVFVAQSFGLMVGSYFNVV